MLLPYTKKQLFGLVNDIANYPEFVPACIKAGILAGPFLLGEGSKDTYVEASMTFGKAGFTETIVTRNTIRQNSIELQLIDGPLHSLHGAWLFQELGVEGCKVTLQLEFRLNTAVLEAMFVPVLDRAVGQVIAAFCNRAEVLYG